MSRPRRQPLVLRCETRKGLTKPRRWLPRSELWYRLRCKGAEYTFHWKPFNGIQLVAYTFTGSDGVVRERNTPRGRTMTMKRLKILAGSGLPQVGVSSTSVIWGKLPKLREHLSALAYEEGEVREPGYMWIKTTLSQWVITIFEPSACARMDIRAGTLDEALLLAEKLLGAEDAPWEIDQFLVEKRAKKSKKKGA